MSLLGVITTFATGTYTVTRTAAGAFAQGRYTPGAASTFAVVACVQPPTGRKLEPVAEGQRGEETRTMFSPVALVTRAPGQEPDVVTVDGEPWTVIEVQHWRSRRGHQHWRCQIARKVQP